MIPCSHFPARIPSVWRLRSEARQPGWSIHESEKRKIPVIVSQRQNINRSSRQRHRRWKRHLYDGRRCRINIALGVERSAGGVKEGQRIVAARGGDSLEIDVAERHGEWRRETPSP